MNETSMEKLPEGSRFIDLSDYGRPLALHLVRFLVPYTSITAITVTLAATVAGLIAAVLIWNGLWLIPAALLLPLKSMLDAADGSLARARNTPSQVGRFLDSFCDFFVHLALFIAIAHFTGQSYLYAAAAFFLAIFQVSVCNYYYVIKRHAAAGDCTSEIDQRELPKPFPPDNPSAMKFLHRAYLVLYWWQDRLVYHLDPAATQGGAGLTPAFMTAVSPLAMGFQLLLIGVLITLNQAQWILFIFTVPATLYALAAIGYRRWLLDRRAAAVA
ncbi:MAG: CDP-alcohol phosphatidyltransferase family protein [Gammaproteobacteria bacterium]